MIFNGGTFIPVAGIYITQLGTRQVIRWTLIANWFVSACSYVLFVTISSKIGFAPLFLASGIITITGFIFNIIFMIQTEPKMKKTVHI